MRAHHRLDARVECARDLDHPPHIERIRSRDHQHTRPRDMLLNENGGFRSVAGYSGYPALAQLLDDLAILLGHHKRYALLGQSFPDAPADAAIARQHQVSGQAIQVDGHRQHRQWIIRAFQGLREFRAGANPGLYRLDRVEHQWIECNRNQRPRENWALSFRRQDPEGNDEVRQDERELSDLRQARRYVKSRVERVAAQMAESE